MAGATEQVDVTEEMSDVIDSALSQSRGARAAEQGPAVIVTAEIAGGSDSDATASHAQVVEILEAVRRALGNDRLMRQVARRADVNVEAFLHLLLREFDAVPAGSQSGLALSEFEQKALEGANVDLSGLPEGVDDPVELTTSRFAVLFARAFSVADAAQRLGVTPGRIRQRIGDRTLHAVRIGSAEWRLPAWQFTEAGALPGLDVVLPQLPSLLHPMSVHGFMTTPNADLDIDGNAVAPVVWLSTGGDAEPVAALARGLPAAP